MEMAIKKTIRNVDSIMNRILSIFYKMGSEESLIPRYEVSTLFDK